MSTVELSNVTVERDEDGLATLQVEVAPEAIRVTRERIIKEYSRRMRVPGFRPGHIPTNIVRRNVGDETIAQAVSDELVPAAYQQALQQSDLLPMERAEVDQLTFDAFEGDKPLQFTARVVVRPKFELSELKNLPATRPVIETTDADVDEALEQLRAEHTRLRDIEERGAQEGDVVSGTLQVYLDGTPRHEEPVRLRPFLLGESGSVPRIDEHLIGAGLDEERRFNITYPSDFQDAELAGQIAEFAVTLTALKERVLPEIDDAFAQSVGVDDMATLRERLREFVTQNRERESREAVRTQLTQAATEATPVEVPARLVATRTQLRISNLEHELTHRQSSLDQYLEETGKTREELEADLKGEVEIELHRELVLDEIARRENLETSDEEIEAYYRTLANMLEQPIEKVVEEFDVHGVRASIIRRKAVDFLVENADITEEAR